ncbi:MAG: CDC48 family AAA ATPase [Bradymonadaceae bacterium]
MNQERSPSKDSVSLQVAEANERDVGKGTVRMSRKAFQQLDARQGDIVEITGDRKTAAIALPPYAQDEGLPIVRLDGLVRTNARVSIGDHVDISEADVEPADKVVVAPAQENLRIRGSGAALRDTLGGRPVTSGDVISTSVYRQSPDMDSQQFPDDIFRQFFQRRSFGLREIRLVVVSTDPSDVVVRVTPDTEIELREEYSEPREKEATKSTYVTYDDIGGLDDAVDEVREMIELPLKSPELFERLGIDPPKGVLLHGPPGTGKTLLARAVANESEANFYPVAGPEIMGKYYGESEQRLREVFEEAEQDQPAIIFFDEIDSIAPKREQVGAETERRVVAQLLTLMDGLEPRQNVMVIATTNQIDQMDEALRRPGRFDREIVIGVPDTEGRREILNIHTRGMPLTDDVDLHELAEMGYGYVGADLASLTREAAMEALRRSLPQTSVDETQITQEFLDSLEVTRQDFIEAHRRIQPSAMREIMVEVPEVQWDDVGGVEDAKETLREGIELPLTSPESFRRLGIRPAKGFLLFGPPGTGKTLMAKAVAREAKANFVATKSSDLLSKWYGESEKQLSKLFNRARQVSPTVIFIDEIDSLAPQRGGQIGESGATERVVNTLLAEMDGLEVLGDVVVIGATNRPSLLDPALLRPGRFDEIVYVKIPDEDGRRKILEIHTADMPLADDVNLGHIAARTGGYTGADLENLTRQAGLTALRADIDTETILMEHFNQAVQQTRASVTAEMTEEYEKIAEELQHESPQRSEQIGFQPTDED